MGQIRAGGDGTRSGAERLGRREHVIPEEHARLEAARPHVGEEHQEVARGGDGVSAIQLNLILEPHHLGDGREKVVTREWHGVTIPPH